jgi:hypothetical protein
VFIVEERERSYQEVGRLTTEEYLTSCLKRESTLPLKSGVKLVEPAA